MKVYRNNWPTILPSAVIKMMCHRQNVEISCECNHFLESSLPIQCLDIVQCTWTVGLFKLITKWISSNLLMINCVFQWNASCAPRKKICSRIISIAHDHDQNKRGYCVEWPKKEHAHSWRKQWKTHGMLATKNGFSSEKWRYNLGKTYT